MPNLNLLAKSQHYFTTTSLTDVHQCADKRKEDVTVHFCNQTAAQVAVSLAVAMWDFDTDTADADASKQYQVFGLIIPANNIFKYSLTLTQKDTIRVKVGTANAVSITINIDESRTLTT